MGITGFEGVLESVSKGKSMNRKMVKTITLRTFALVAVLCAARSGRAADATTPYPSMAPLEQYLMADRDAEIALARSAAPPSISSDATVMVLGRHGYETAVEGKNGFVCIVERAWMGAFDSAEFWNAKNRGPSCFNPQAARSVLPITLKRTDLALAGLSKAQIMDGIKKAFQNKELPALESGRDDLYDVEARATERPRRALASSSHVLRSRDRRYDLGCRRAGLPGSAESTL